ncbi:hypothetical protein QOT17_011748 [Balamuthia mandrillaris]
MARTKQRARRRADPAGDNGGGSARLSPRRVLPGDVVLQQRERRRIWHNEAHDEPKFCVESVLQLASAASSSSCDERAVASTSMEGVAFKLAEGSTPFVLPTSVVVLILSFLERPLDFSAFLQVDRSISECCSHPSFADPVWRLLAIRFLGLTAAYQQKVESQIFSNNAQLWKWFGLWHEAFFMGDDPCSVVQFNNLNISKKGRASRVPKLLRYLWTEQQIDLTLNEWHPFFQDGGFYLFAGEFDETLCKDALPRSVFEEEAAKEVQHCNNNDEETEEDAQQQADWQRKIATYDQLILKDIIWFGRGGYDEDIAFTGIYVGEPYDSLVHRHEGEGADELPEDLPIVHWWQSPMPTTVCLGLKRWFMEGNFVWNLCYSSVEEKAQNYETRKQWLLEHGFEVPTGYEDPTALAQKHVMRDLRTKELMLLPKVPGIDLGFYDSLEELHSNDVYEEQHRRQQEQRLRQQLEQQKESNKRKREEGEKEGTSPSTSSSTKQQKKARQAGNDEKWVCGICEEDKEKPQRLFANQHSVEQHSKAKHPGVAPSCVPINCK